MAEGAARADTVYLASFSNGGLTALMLALMLVNGYADPLFPSAGMGMANGRAGEPMLGV